jgi:hypothetical protein
MKGRKLDDIPLNEPFENQGETWQKISKDGKVYLCCLDGVLWVAAFEIDEED